MRKSMQRWKSILYNTSFALNCLLVFLLMFEKGLVVPPWVQTIGRMHPLLLHFPIVLVLLCIFWEAVSGFRKSITEEQRNIGDGLLLLASTTAVISALMGLLLSKEDGYTQEVVAWHKWGGVSISLLALGWYTFRNSVRNTKGLLALASATGIATVIITGHLGADITHGDNFLLAPVSKEKLALPVLFEDVIIYTNMVQPILKAKCISCHNTQKAKGELVMESFVALRKGGKDGALWDSTQENFGLLMGRIHLPMENKKHMPPLGKPQLTDEETSILYHWIKGGANDTTKVAVLPVTDTLHILATTLFNTIETDDYTFKSADESKIKALRNNYRLVAPLSLGSPALGVQFFSAVQFKPEQLKELLAVKEQVVTLNLNKMPVQDEDLATIAQFVNLRKLNLSFTNIKGTGLQELSKLKELKELSLSGTGVNAASLSALASLPKLTQLYIWSTPAQNQNLATVQRQFKNTKIETGFTGDTIIIKLNKPLIENEEQVLLQPVALKLKHYVKGVTIRYTTDGTEPDSILSPVYKSDFMLDKNTTIKAKVFKPGWISSDVTEKTFYKAGYKIDSIRFVQPAADEPYKKMSAAVLADGQKGDQNFRSGKWIGFRGYPMQAILYFDTVRNISSVTISSLVDINGFIMPPQQLEVWAGKDLEHLHLLKKINPEQPVKEAPGYLKGYELNFAPVKEKYIKVVVTPVAKLPNWHKGKNDKGWIFVDEIFLN
ncbi:FN3 associated domain-containing protein [Ferruginibacter sp.]|uniref:FN3 associated domain-containing protein n=1 Tax=Ferruginibacter sp. TaxID=1940288 RepID=UPI00374CA16C